MPVGSICPIGDVPRLATAPAARLRERGRDEDQREPEQPEEREHAADHRVPEAPRAVVRHAGHSTGEQGSCRGRGMLEFMKRTHQRTGVSGDEPRERVRSAPNRDTRGGNASLVTAAALALLVLVIGAPRLRAQPAGPTGALPDDESISERMLLEHQTNRVDQLAIGIARTHHDEHGYPETRNGLLALESSPDGPILTMRGDPLPYLLYAQYVNRQRAAVFLARTGTVRDPLPDGGARAIPFGYGSLKRTTIYVSIVESLLLPHISDTQTEYADFPLIDLYVGGGFGLTGPSAQLRYVHTERYVGQVSIGYNPFRGATATSVLNRFIVPLHLSAGYRFPGAFPELLGENNWTVGADLMIGFGDRDGNPATPPGILVPGVVLDVERILFDSRGLERDFRTDPRPYNYRVNALLVRAGAYLNVGNLGSGELFYPVFSISYQVNAIGPRIPEHEFKETDVLFVNDVYREDLRRQTERREERANRR